MNYPAYSLAPAPTALRRRLRRAHLRRCLSTPLLGLALVVLLVAISCLSVTLGAVGLVLTYFGVRWSGEPVKAWVHTGPLEWF